MGLEHENPNKKAKVTMGLKMGLEPMWAARCAWEAVVKFQVGARTLSLDHFFLGLIGFWTDMNNPPMWNRNCAWVILMEYPFFINIHYVQNFSKIFVYISANFIWKQNPQEL